MRTRRNVAIVVLCLLFIASGLPDSDVSSHTAASEGSRRRSARNEPAATAVVVYSAPEILALSDPDAHFTTSENQSTQSAFLDELAKDTWAYLSSEWATSNHLPWSWRSASIPGGDYANTAEIGLYALSWLAVHDLGRPWVPTWVETESEINAILDQLRDWQTGSQSEQPHGPNAYQKSAFYQWYWISPTPPVVGAGSNDHAVPSIDNAWLAASLITISEYAQANGHLAMAQKADDILNDLDFSIWYNSETHRFAWGEEENPRGDFEADYYSNENRIINFVARALGHLSPEEFLLSLEALEQPAGTYDEITVLKVAWDGSYFTYASPALFIREMETLYGLGTIIPATQTQIAYASAQGYDAWGLSDCFDVGNGGYVQQGARPTAMTNTPEMRPGLVTPHAGALALITPLSTEATANLQTLASTFTSAYDSTYGFYDSVMTRPSATDYGQRSERFSALAQEWMLLAIVNHQTEFIWDHFYQHDGVNTTHLEMFRVYETYLPLVMAD